MIHDVESLNGELRTARNRDETIGMSEDQFTPISRRAIWAGGEQRVESDGVKHIRKRVEDRRFTSRDGTHRIHHGRANGFVRLDPVVREKGVCHFPIE